MRRLAASVVVLAGLVLGVAARPAAASCAPPVPLEDAIVAADLVFVGTVTEVVNGDRWATFALEQLWKGEPGPGALEVRGGPANGMTTVDRSWVRDGRYLVVARAPGAEPFDDGPGARWVDSACSATQPWDPALARFRPEGAAGRAPGSAGSGGQPPPVVGEPEPVLPGTTIEGNGIGVLIVLGGTVAALAFAYLSLRRHQPSPSG